MDDESVTYAGLRAAPPAQSPAATGSFDLSGPGGPRDTARSRLRQRRQIGYHTNLDEFRAPILILAKTPVRNGRFSTPCYIRNILTCMQLGRFLGSGLINSEDSFRRRFVIHSGWRWP